MSFNSSVKTETVSKLELNDRECKAFLSAVVRAGSLGVVKGRLNAEISLDTPSVAPFIESCFRRINRSAEINIRSLEHAIEVTVVVENASDLLNELNILGSDGKKILKLFAGIPPLGTEGEKRAYVIGYFLVAGVAAIPSTELTSNKNGYRVEINVVSASVAEQLADIVHDLGIDIKIGERRNLPYVYLRDGQQIADFLALLGASDAIFELQNVSILKNTKNELNRVNNCAVANMNKTAGASALQRDAINKILEQKGWGYFSPALAAIARLRLDNPFSTLDELAELTSPPVTKSGVKHRLGKIVELADQLPDK